MKVAIIGYGKMGKLIEKFALEKGHTIGLVIDSNSYKNLTTKNLRKCDIAIEFSTPDSALKNIIMCINARIPIVVGTTGKWYENLELVKQRVKENNTSLLYATNFSIGVNIFFAINTYLAKIMALYPNYNPEIIEIHHTHKKDSPSGTAITLANDILNKLSHKKKWINTLSHNNSENPVFDNNILPIKSFRKDPAPGTHIIQYISETDSIKIEHEAFNRSGFALGAVLAAEWLKDKKGTFTMQDIIKFN